jgi:hypothetical protein
MLSEVVNALLLTFLATEYLLIGDSTTKFPSSYETWKRIWISRRNRALVISAIIINVFDRISGIASAAEELFQGALHIPKIVFAAIAYIIALYVDCRRKFPLLHFWREFLPRVLKAFCYVLPVYPFMAVVISFGFLLVINLFEFLHIPLEYLNMPIYYGTLYGPFSLVYWRVKEEFDQRRNSLPG